MINKFFSIGVVQTRLLAQVLYTGAWIALSYYRVQQYVVYCWMLLAFSGFGFLMSNYATTSQYLPGYAGTLITIFCGVFDASK